MKQWEKRKTFCRTEDSHTSICRRLDTKRPVCWYSQINNTAAGCGRMKVLYDQKQLLLILTTSLFLHFLIEILLLCASCAHKLRFFFSNVSAAIQSDKAMDLCCVESQRKQMISLSCELSCKIRSHNVTRFNFSTWKGSWVKVKKKKCSTESNIRTKR